MDPSAPSWTACVLTCAKKLSDYGDLKNSILYADSVNWVPAEVLVMALGTTLHIAEKGRGDEWSSAIRAAKEGELDPAIEEFRAAGYGGHFAAHFEFQHELDAAGLRRHVRQRMTIAELSDRASLRDEKGRLTIENLGPASEAVISDAMKGCRFIVDHRRKGQLNGVWDTYYATTHLMQALSQLLLADVSSLPLEALAELRDLLSDTLDPMRAELLRFTEDLRRLIGERPLDPVLIAAEARNLIATRVEPVVREANSRTQQLADRKWKKLYVSAAKAFGFAGAALVDPKLIAKAIQQTLEIGALTVNDPRKMSL